MNGIGTGPRMQLSDDALRRAREEELRLVLEQKALVEARLEELAAYGVTPANLPAVRTKPGIKGVAGKAAKRPGLPAPGGAPPKKAKLDDPGRRVESLWGQCNTILKQLKKQRDAAPFCAPVDPIKLQIPDYHKFVTRPMDLGTISNKLENKPERGKAREYRTPYEFRDDVRQVWDNCRLYNPVGSVVRGFGDRMSDAWEKKWHQADIERKWEALQAELMEAELGPTAVIPHKLKAMDEELSALRSKLEAHEGVSKRPLSETGPRELTFDEKRRLSQNLGSLPGEKLGPVLEIVAEAATMGEDDEVELDIDSLGMETLWKLDQYVNEVMQAAARKADQSNKNNGLVVPAQEGVSADPSRPAATPAPAGAAAAAPVAAAAAAAATPPRSGQPVPSPQASTSSSGSGSSSSSGSDSGGEVGSKENADSTGAELKKQPSAAGDAHGDVSTLVSATVPSSGPPIYQQKTKKDVQLQNAAAWQTLSAVPDDSAPDAADAEGGEAAAPDAPDALWSEFQSREAQQLKREQEKKEEEERQKREKDAALAEAEAVAQRRRDEEAAEKEAQRRAAEEAAEAQKRAIEEMREAELAQLKNMDVPAEGLGEGQKGILKKLGGDGAADLSILGLQMKPDEEEEEFEDEDEDGMEVDAEEGEI